MDSLKDGEGGVEMMQSNGHPAPATVRFDASSLLLQGAGDCGVIPAMPGRGHNWQGWKRYDMLTGGYVDQNCTVQ